MIPKKIHYCWFGRNPLPADAQKCIASWRKFLPDHEIIEWNEDNFPIDICPYTTEAYALKKYAFVSDYARFYILYHHGGVYFDTDVEVIKPFADILAGGSFMGIEKSLATEGRDPTVPVGVNPGLGFAAEAGLPVLKEIIDYYDTLHYTPEAPTIVYHTTEVLKRHGLESANRQQEVAGLTIYPTDWLCPMDSTTGKVSCTENTVSIHHYSCSWIDRNTISFRLHLLKNALVKICGEGMVMRLASLLRY